MRTARRPVRAGKQHVSDDERDEPSRRQVAKRQRRAAGEGSARLAKALMELPESAIGKLDLDEDLRAVVDRARAVTAHGARRRAERTLAGELRRAELGDLEERMASAQAGGAADVRLFHLAERWRARLLDGGAAADELPGGDPQALAPLLENARRERDTGRPPGAARALFRHILAVLKAAERAGG